MIAYLRYLSVRLYNKFLNFYLKFTPKDYIYSQINKYVPSDSYVNKSEVVIVILTRDKIDLLSKLFKSLEKFEDNFLKYKFLIVDNGSDSKSKTEILDLCNSYSNIQVFNDDIDFNFSKLNNNVILSNHFKQFSSSKIILMNNDIEIREANTVTRLCDILEDPNVGIVGCQLLYSINSVQHSGIVFRSDKQPMHLNKLIRNKTFEDMIDIPAVTGAMLGIRYEDYLKVNGMDEKLPLSYNDVDLCLKVKDLGKIVVCANNITAFHHESSTRKKINNRVKFTENYEYFRYFLSKWTNRIQDIIYKS